MDDFSFIDSMLWICEKNKQELFSYEKGLSFQEYNRRLFNYLNSVYVYVQFCKTHFGKYCTQLNELFNKYRQEELAYRFLLEYRNCVTHQGIIIKTRESSGFWIDLDNLLKAEQKNIDYKIKKKKKGVEIPDLYFFKDLIKDMMETAYEQDGKHYIKTTIFDNAHTCLLALHKDTLSIIFSEFIKPLLIWLLEQIYRDDKKYWYTFIADETELPSGEIMVEDVFEPNYYLELYIDNLKDLYGINSTAFSTSISLLKEKGYDYLFEKGCTLDDYLQELSVE